MYGLLYTDYLTELDKERRFVLCAKVDNADNVVSLDDYSEPKLQLKVACKLLAHIYNGLPLFTLLEMFHNIARDAELPERLAEDLLKEILSEVVQIHADCQKWSSTQVEDMLAALSEVSRSMAKKKKQEKSVESTPS